MQFIEQIHRQKRRLQKRFIATKNKYFGTDDKEHSLLSDKSFIEKQFFNIVGTEIDLRSPQTYAEKLCWLKLYDRQPRYTRMVDKIESKEWAKELIGSEYILPTIGIFNCFDEIDLDMLPEQFILKCSHDSGSYVICRDKSDFDINAAREFLESRLSFNYYRNCREYPYKNITPRILAEEFMQNTNGGPVIDYKVYCFGGKVRIIQVNSGRFLGREPYGDCYDTDWCYLGLQQDHYPMAGDIFPKPDCLDELIRISEKLSSDIPTVRVDFNCWNDRLYFGEMTFYDNGGYTTWHPEEWNLKMGEWIKLPPKR